MGGGEGGQSLAGQVEMGGQVAAAHGGEGGQYLVAQERERGGQHPGRP